MRPFPSSGGARSGMTAPLRIPETGPRATPTGGAGAGEPAAAGCGGAESGAAADASAAIPARVGGGATRVRPGPPDGPIRFGGTVTGTIAQSIPLPYLRDLADRFAITALCDIA